MTGLRTGVRIRVDLADGRSGLEGELVSITGHHITVRTDEQVEILTRWHAIRKLEVA